MNEYIDSFDVNGDQYDLRDSNAISTLPQTLTSAQQQQAQENIALSGAVKYNAEQTLTVAQKEQAQKNIGVTYPCNPNLLDNWYFGNPVNQRGETSYTNATWSAEYCIDRWCLSVASFEPATQTVTTVSNWGRIFQYLEGTSLVGKTVTLSVLYEDLTGGGIAIFVGPGDAGQTSSTAPSGLVSSTVTMPDVGSSKNSVTVALNTAEQSAKILAVKLELGSQQTLAHQDADGNWVLNEIPDYGEQLARCQRYYHIYSSASARPALAVDCSPVMRTDPAQSTITVGSTTYYANSADL